MNPKDLVPDFIKRLEPYASPTDNAPEAMIWLNTNEYPIATKFEMRFETLNRYPEVQPQAFIRRYADYAGVKPEEVLVTRGGDEAIELLIRTFCTPFKDAVLYAAPTYSMYAISAKTCGVHVIEVAPKKNLQLDITRLCSVLKEDTQNVKIVFLCRPNNPTGEVVSKGMVEKVLLAAKDAIVVVDEAYIEFCLEESVADLLNQYTNLALVRTLSKAFALAGLRCGMILANREIIDVLRKVIAPYPIPEPVAIIAEHSLSNGGIAAMKQRVQVIAENRDYLIGELRKLKAVNSVFQTKTNFVLFELDNAHDIYQKLWLKGVAIREPGAGDNTLRVSVGTLEECRTFVRKLTAILMEARR